MKSEKNIETMINNDDLEVLFDEVDQSLVKGGVGVGVNGVEGVLLDQWSLKVEECAQVDITQDNT